MPSRKLAARCPCGSKNHLRARHCNECGQRVDGERLASARTGRNKLHADIAHPINAECREFIQNRVTEEYKAEILMDLIDNQGQDAIEVTRQWVDENEAYWKSYVDAATM